LTDLGEVQTVSFNYRLLATTQGKKKEKDRKVHYTACLKKEFC